MLNFRKKAKNIAVMGSILFIIVICVFSFLCPREERTTEAPAYADTIFDTSYVHTIDISMHDWSTFIDSCENEKYTDCNVTVDGKEYKNIAIRAKGNTSLSNVKELGSERYSFKLEFDHYASANSLDGLDKLCLNNLIQDNTMMKDYLVYQMMNDFGVDSPLCSYAYLTVNGEDWGLYLAVEGIEDSFCIRTYGDTDSAVYKPDSMGFGGGRGNGKDFRMENFEKMKSEAEKFEPPHGPDGERPPRGANGERPMHGPDEVGKDDVKLKYIDNQISSYANIFDNAKATVSNADKQRLISSLEKLSTYSDIDEILDTEEVIRYFVVHNFVCNGDSYTGSMIHNYYLREKDGKMSMIPWDYNLAFGTFGGGRPDDAQAQENNRDMDYREENSQRDMDTASSVVNSNIDNPVSGGDLNDRPMIGWIFSDETYTVRYHEAFSTFLETWYASGRLEKMINETADLIRPYVMKDPTKFCSGENFENGVTAIAKFAALRGEAVTRQLAGDTTLVDADTLVIADMGTMGQRGRF